MRFRELIKEEGYDKQRDADAVSGKPRKTSVGGGKKPKGYSKDKAEKAAMDNVKKALAKESATGMGAASIATAVGNVGPTISRNMYNDDGTMKNGVDFDNLMGGKKKSKKRKKA